MSVQGSKYSSSVLSHSANTVDDVADMFEARATKALESTRRSAEIEAWVWRDAANMLRRTKIQS